MVVYASSSDHNFEYNGVRKYFTSSYRPGHKSQTWKIFDTAQNKIYNTIRKSVK